MGLEDVEHVNNVPSGYDTLSLLSCFLVGFVSLAAPMTDDRGQNRNPFLALLDEPAELVPCTNAGYVRGVRPGAENCKKVGKAVAMESRHCYQVLSHRFALS